MKPEIILQSDLLDIIFEHRNKDYGAYTLRKNYHKRLLQALSGTTLLVFLFVMLQSMQLKEKGAQQWALPDLTVVDYYIPPAPPPPPQPAPPLKTLPPTVLNDAPPVITNNPVDKPLATQDELSQAVLGTQTNIVPSPGGEAPPVDRVVAATIATIPVTTEIENNEPLMHADIMPSFNGDIVKFMTRHLRQPDDLEPGEKIMVNVRFVVTRDGDISDVEVVRHGRPDLDQEVIRVVKKMPRWNPGKQGGRFVPVYFNLPVTFVSYAE